MEPKNQKNQKDKKTVSNISEIRIALSVHDLEILMKKKSFVRI